MSPGRYQVMKHETFSDSTQDSLRRAGVEPSTLYTLVDAFDDPGSAIMCLVTEQITNQNPYINYVLHDQEQIPVIIQ